MFLWQCLRQSIDSVLIGRILLLILQVLCIFFASYEYCTVNLAPSEARLAHSSAGISGSLGFTLFPHSSVSESAERGA